MVRTWRDTEGDEVREVLTPSFRVEAVRCLGTWAVSFHAREDDPEAADSFDRLTGLGAFRAIREIRPAVEELVSSFGPDAWCVVAEPRRAKLYSRYLRAERIRELR